jgi:hypothetical protein
MLAALAAALAGISRHFIAGPIVIVQLTSSGMPPSNKAGSARANSYAVQAMFDATAPVLLIPKTANVLRETRRAG